MWVPFFILQGFIYSIGSVDKTDAKVNFEYSFLNFEPVLKKKSDIENQLKWTEMNHTSKWISLPWQLHDIT